MRLLGWSWVVRGRGRYNLEFRVDRRWSLSCSDVLNGLRIVRAAGIGFFGRGDPLTTICVRFA
jgi:hypothetical protein